MSTQDGKYNIKAISKMLGIQPGTLRAWERRYHIIEPVRNQAGHRLYTDKHVAILRWLIEKINKGFTIGQAVDLLEKGSVSFDEDIERETNNQAFQLSEKLIRLLLKFHENEAAEILNHAFSLFTYEKVTMEIIAPVLKKVGDLWEQKEITVAHEHFVSSFFRTKLGTIFHSIPIAGYLPKVIAVCSPNEMHELGLLIFTLFLRRKGFEVIYLGAGVPEKDVEVVIRETDARYLFTSCTLSIHLPSTLTFIRTLGETHPHLIIGLGGRAVQAITEHEKKELLPYLIGNEKQDWEKWIGANLFINKDNG